MSLCPSLRSLKIFRGLQRLWSKEAKDVFTIFHCSIAWTKPLKSFSLYWTASSCMRRACYLIIFLSACCEICMFLWWQKDTLQERAPVWVFYLMWDKVVKAIYARSYILVAHIWQTSPVCLLWHRVISCFAFWLHIHHTELAHNSLPFLHYSRTSLIRTRFKRTNG